MKFQVKCELGFLFFTAALVHNFKRGKSACEYMLTDDYSRICTKRYLVSFEEYVRCSGVPVLPDAAMLFSSCSIKTMLSGISSFIEKNQHQFITRHVEYSYRLLRHLRTFPCQCLSFSGACLSREKENLDGQVILCKAKEHSRFVKSYPYTKIHI